MFHYHNPVASSLLLFAMMATTGSEAAENVAPATWPQWRGPNRNAKIEADPWPERLDKQALRRAWSVALGPSYSGPIVGHDRVFVTETVDQKYEAVHALHRETGEKIWSAQWEGSLSVPFFAKSNGDWIRSTPAWDGEHLYVAGMRDVLVCLRGDTGKEVWRVNFVSKLNAPVPQFGFVCSPLVVGDHVYVQAGASFVKLNKYTGDIVWRTLQDGGGMFGSAFSSPTWDTIAGVPQLVVQTRAKLAGVDPASGQVLWSEEVPAFRGMNILTPTVYGDAVFTSSYGGRTFLYTVNRAAEGLKISPAWDNKSQGYMSSPVVINGHVYLHLRNQRFICIELATGQTKWSTRPFGKYWSLVANGDQILSLDSDGTLRLIRANPERFELLDERKVSKDSWAHLAVCDQEIFIREINAMTVYRWEG